MPIAAESLRLGPWRSGVNYSLPAEDMPPDGLYEMENCTVGLAGEVSKRNGFAKYNSSAMNSGATVTACGQVVLAGTEKTFAFAGNKFYDVTGGTATDRTGTVTITAGNDYTWDWVLAGSTLIAVNGQDTDGIKWTGGSANAATLDDDSRFTKPKWVTFWENRAWVANVNGAADRVWRSDAGDIETWDSLGFYSLGFDITGLRPFQNVLSIHTEQGIHTLTPTGNSTIPFQQQQRTQRGTVAGKSIVTVPGERQLFVRNDGIYQWSGGSSVEKISLALDDRYWSNLNVSRLPYSFSLYYPAQEQVWFFLPYGASQTTMNSVVIYSARLNAWFGPYNGFARDSAALIDDLPHAGDFAGHIMKHDSGTNDDGSAIRGSFETAAIAPFGDAIECRWLYNRLLYDNEGAHDLDIAQISAGIVSNFQTVQMGQTGALLNSTFVLNTSTLESNVSGLTSDSDLFGYDARTRLRISNYNTDETFTIRRTSLQYKPIGNVRQRKTGIE
jgi:hypothetical protein